MALSASASSPLLTAPLRPCAAEVCASAFFVRVQENISPEHIRGRARAAVATSLRPFTIETPFRKPELLCEFNRISTVNWFPAIAPRLIDGKYYRHPTIGLAVSSILLPQLV